MEETPPPLPVPKPPLDFATLRTLASAALLTIVGDFLLWPGTPCLSLGLFAVASCTAIFLRRPAAAPTRSEWIAAALLIATAVQTAIEISFSNILVLLLLLAAILGEASFPAIRTGWLRWTEGMWALVRVPMAWLWAAPALKRLPRKPANAKRVAAFIIQVSLPTVAVVIVFAVLLGNGNAIFAQWIGDLINSGFELIPSVSAGRILLWLVLATFALGILRPAAPVLSEKAFTGALPPMAEPRDLKLAQWRTLSILGALNVLFFAANTIDGIYLWIHQTLPEGVSYSAFVHQGVQSLTIAVLLSAVVLTMVYQQAPSVIAGKAVRILSLIWIAQNVVLIAGVLMRLQLYVKAYQLSELRIYVAIFLCLVAIGFALLARRIIASKSLQWLLLANSLAALAVFFVVQFLDVAHWVADYNVARWQEDTSRGLDVPYLKKLGHSAYPALIRVAETAERTEAHDAFLHLQARKDLERYRLEHLNWRSAQIRRDKEARLLVEHELRTRR